MSRIFLGPVLHWLIVLVLIVLGWLAGIDRMHVSQFNLFLIILIGITIAVVILVLKSSPTDGQVTRDPIEGDD